MLEDSFKSRDVILEIKTAEDIGLDVDLNLKDKPDFVIFWDKDIYLAQRLENLGIRLFNNASAIELCDNKILMYQELNKYGIRIPKTYIAPKTFENVGYTSLDFIEKIKEEIGVPFIIKEAYGSFGEQVYLVNNNKQLEKTINHIGHKDFLIQEFIESSAGRDIRINVVNN